MIEEDVKTLISVMSINRKNWKWPGNKNEIYYNENYIVKKLDQLIIVAVSTKDDYKFNDIFKTRNGFLI